METDRKILLTFDLEEFDLPVEYGIEINTARQLKLSTDGLKTVIKILTKHQVSATFFTTAFYAENNPVLINEIVRAGHEIGSHLYYHSDYNENHILSSRQKLEEITEQKVLGFRMPRLKKTDLKLIMEAGYLYDSSMNPTYIPGRYNNLCKPKTIYKDGNSGIFVLPFSVATIFRIPLFWLSFKNIPVKLYFFLCKMALKNDNYLHLYMHPWEFADLDGLKLPKFIKRIDGEALAYRLDKLIYKLKEEGDFITTVEFITSINDPAPKSRKWLFGLVSTLNLKP